MLYSVPAALRRHSCTTFVSMMVTKPIRTFSSASPVTQTADTYTYFPGLLEVPLRQWPILWPDRQRSTEDKSTSSALRCWVSARSPQPVGTGDGFSSPPRSTRGARTAVLLLQGGQTLAAMRERKVAGTQPGGPTQPTQPLEITKTCPDLGAVPPLWWCLPLDAQ